MQYDNNRKRVLKEQIDIILRANKELIEKLLPVIDSFEHALEMGEDLKSVGDETIYNRKQLLYKFLICS